jgi:hypothetical protein
MAAEQTRQGHPPARPQAKSIKRLIGVLRAGWQMPASISRYCGKTILVRFDQPACSQSGHPARQLD